MNLLQRYLRLSFWNKLAAWGSFASLTGLTFAVFVYFGGIQENNRTTDPLNNLLVEHLNELDDIERNWKDEYAKVEVIAGRAAAALEVRFPQHSKNIRNVLASALESREMLRLLRQELHEAQDQLMTENDSDM